MKRNNENDNINNNVEIISVMKINDNDEIIMIIPIMKQWNEEEE